MRIHFLNKHYLCIQLLNYSHTKNIKELKNLTLDTFICMNVIIMVNFIIIFNSLTMVSRLELQLFLTLIYQKMLIRLSFHNITKSPLSISVLCGLEFLYRGRTTNEQQQSKEIKQHTKWQQLDCFIFVWRWWLYWLSREECYNIS